MVQLSIELPHTAYVEGSAIDVTVLARADRDVVVAGGDVELVRTVIYRYRQWGSAGGSNTATARGSQVAARAVLDAAGPLPAGQPLVQQVRLQVPPDGPGSAHTQLLDIRWAVHARLRMKGSRDAQATEHLLVLSEARDCADVATSDPMVTGRGRAVLGFESLSSRRLIGGVPLSGVLTVAPLRTVTARALRLDLVLLEHVAHGPWLGDDPARNPAHEDKDAENVVAAVMLAGRSARLGRRRRVNPHSTGEWLSRIQYEWTAVSAPGRIRIEAQQHLRFPFRLEVPKRLPAPTVRTPQYSLRWLLRGVLDRRLRADPSVSLELHAVTTHP